MTRSMRSLPGILGIALLALSQVATAQVNDFGVGGILDIPSARMNEENELTVT